MIILKKVEVNDFRSFVKEEIIFDGTTTIVGANEGGKTNILDAIDHLVSEDGFKQNDLRKGSKNYPYGQISIKYTLSLDETIIPELLEALPVLRGRDFVITKKGKVNQDPEFSYELSDVRGIDKIVHIKKVKAFRKEFDKEQIKLFEEALDRKWFVKKTSLNLSHSPFPKLKKEKSIEIIDTEGKINSFLAPKIFEEIQDRLNVYFWKYDKSSFLQNITPVEEFVNNPDKFPAMKNLFLVAEWKLKDFRRNLIDIDANDATVKMKEVEREIQKLIRKTWRQHRDLAISLQHMGDNLLLNLQELTAPTPPEIRSDGLKWFLSFLINFRAKTKLLSDFIILIDEPALHLHPRGQKDVLSEIKELAESNQIVYTTHQTFMIDRNHQERIRILTRESTKSGGPDYYFASKISEITKSKDILTDPLLRESLGFNVSDISPINEKNILVEGNFDRNLIYLLNSYFPVFDLETYSVISCDGAPDIKRSANFYLSNDLQVFCLYDSDSSGVTCYSDKADNAVPKKIKTHIQLLDDSFQGLETPEDLFPLDMFIQAVVNTPGLKNFQPADQKPKMQQVQSFFDANSITDKDKKLEIKHCLEDELIKALKIKLAKKQVSEGDNLIKFITALGSTLPKSS